MADSNVYITGSEPGWEVQKTLEGILAAVEKTQQVSKEQKKTFKNATKDGKVFDATAIKKFSGGLKKVTVDTFRQGQANKSLFKTTEDLNKEFKESSKSIKGLAVGFGGVMSVLGFFYQSFMDTIGMFRNLTDQGLSVNMTYMQVTESLQRMGMSINELEGISSKYGTVMGSMGLDNFTNMIAGIGDGFNQFGLTMAEGADWAGEYLQQQRLLANYSIYTQKGLNEAIRSNIERLTSFSKILNVSRTEIQAAQTEAASELRVRARFLVESEKMHEDAEKNFTRIIGHLEGLKLGGVADILTEMMGFTDGKWQLSDQYQEILGTAAAPIGKLIGEMVDKISYEGMSEQEEAGYMLELGELLAENMSTWKTIQENSGLDGASRALFEAALGMAEAKKKGDLNESGEVSPLVEATTTLNQNLNRLKNSVPLLIGGAMEKVAEFLGLGTEDALDGGMTAGMKLVADKAGELADWLLRVVKGEIDWSEEFKKWAEILWKAADVVFSGIETAIAEGAELVADAIDRMNPFNLQANEVTQDSIKENILKRSSLRDQYLQMPEGSLGQNAMLLQEARKYLAGAQRNVDEARERVKRDPEHEGFQENLDRRLEELEQRREMIRELRLQRKEIYKQTEEIAAGNG